MYRLGKKLVYCGFENYYDLDMIEIALSNFRDALNKYMESIYDSYEANKEIFRIECCIGRI